MRRMDKDTIGWRLDKAMQDARIKSQAELARRSGVPQPTVNRILNGEGKKGPETSTLVALANATGVEFLWLQQGQGPQRQGAQTIAGDDGGSEAATHLRAVELKDEPKLQWVTEREADLLSEFRACAEPQKARLLATARRFRKDSDADTARDKA